MRLGQSRPSLAIWNYSKAIPGNIFIAMPGFFLISIRFFPGSGRPPLFLPAHTRLSDLAAGVHAELREAINSFGDPESLIA